MKIQQRLGEIDSTGATGPRGQKLGDYEHPVFDGPQPRDKKPTVPNGMDLNTESDGE